jgi:hypothetical protein
VVVAEFDIHCAGILLKVDAAFGARNRHDEIAFAQQPGEGHVAWLCPDGLGDGPHDLNRIPVDVEILALETGIVLAVVLCCTLLRTLGVTRQEPPAKRAEGNKTDPKFPQRGDDLALQLQALDKRFGRYAGLFPPDASDIGTQCERILGDAVGKYRSAFQRKLETAILASSAKKTKGAVKRASTIANMLCACGLTWKHSLSSQQEFLEKMRDAIQLCCRDLTGD